MSSPRRLINPLWLCRLSYVVWYLHAESIFSYKLSSLGFVAKQGWQYLRRAHHCRSGFRKGLSCFLYVVTVSVTPIRNSITSLFFFLSFFVIASVLCLIWITSLNKVCTFTEFISQLNCRLIWSDGWLQNVECPAKNSNKPVKALEM